MGEIMIPGRDRGAVALALLARQREQHAQQRRKVFLDVRRDDAAQWSPPLHLLHPLVEPRQRDDRLDAVLADRAFELALGISRVDRRDDRANLPGAELGDEELWAVGQEEP